MTNKFLAIANQIKTMLKTAGFNVYIYPDEKVGQNYPVAIIEEGDRSFNGVPGGVFQIEQEIIIYISSNKLTDRSKVMGDLEATAWNALLTNFNIGGTVYNVMPLQTIIGISTDAIDQMNIAGYSGNISSRGLRLSVYYEDCT